MVTDEEIAQGLESLFRETNPNSFTSLNEVILRLQSKLGFDLSHKIDFIRAHLTLLFNSGPPPQPQPPSPAVSSPSPVVVSRHLQHHSINPNPNPNLNFPNSNNPNPNLNFPNSNNPNPNVHVVHPQHRVFHHPPPPSQSYFPRGPTEISFAQPGSFVADSISSPPPKESTQSRPKRRGGPGGLNKLCGVSPQLETIVGQPAMPRTEIVKQLWAYIRKNNLQDPSNKRKIICNDELRLVFEVDCTDMFQMNKLLAKHIVPLDPSKVPEQPSKKAKVEEAEVPSAEPAAPITPAATAQTTAPAPPAVPASPTAPARIVISEALAKFFGTNEKEMSHSEVYKRIEEYIKAEGLEDPLNSVVVCDTKLQELLGCESIPAPGIREALARNHLFPRA